MYGKVSRLFTRVVLITFALLMTVILTPVITLAAAYKLVFSKDNTITMPKVFKNVEAKAEETSENG